MNSSLVETQKLLNKVNLGSQSSFSNLRKTDFVLVVMLRCKLIKQRIFVNKNLNYYWVSLNHIKAMSTQTASIWILEVLGQAGIDTKTIFGHSTRSALSSKTKASGVLIWEILRREFGSKKPTFEKFYQKEISVVESNICFKAVLKRGWCINSFRFTERCRTTSIRSGGYFMKWNLKLHQERGAPCRIIWILWIKLKQRSTSLFNLWRYCFLVQFRSRISWWIQRWKDT